MADFPKDLRYTKEHEWARIEGNTAQIGITSFAVEQLGDVTMVELPQEGESVNKDDVFGTVESVKAVSDLYAPVTGKILKSNTPLDDTPEMVNDDPYGDGWLVEIEISNAAETEELLDAAAYAEFVKEQE
jgi:glycine cleavage system H protein